MFINLLNFILSNNLFLEEVTNPNNQTFDATMALFIALGCFFIPVFTLLMIVVIKKIIKAIKFNHKKIEEAPENIKEKYLTLFGEDNIESISKNMTRVSVVVKNLEAVDFEGLRNLNVGVMITGNVIKCSSQEFADQISE